jgi:6,7-dimethyl-8-ribityllumazine synthase
MVYLVALAVVVGQITHHRELEVLELQVKVMQVALQTQLLVALAVVAVVLVLLEEMPHQVVLVAMVV